jgi:anti-sigma factor RsiW
VHTSGPTDDDDSASDVGVTTHEVTCQQFVELLTDYLEGALPPRTLGQVEEHLVMCDPCVTYLEQMQATIVSLRDLKLKASQEPPDSVLMALRARKATGQ